MFRRIVCWTAQREKRSLGDNIISTYFERKSLNGPLFMRGRRINAEARRLIKEFSIKAESPAQKNQSLSGGNIQKVVVAREHNTNPKCLLASSRRTASTSAARSLSICA